MNDFALYATTLYFSHLLSVSLQQAYFIKIYFHVLYAPIFIFLLLIFHTFLERNKSLAVTVYPDVSDCAVGPN